ncbi:hypothetical protein OSB04_un000301 [Centaurea solstitialis]|uniref:Reverse transcriptase zinc-binding domain-containing protein n=1 Tax=Centaurea solstitialis TaxID=347529 RepID=A0AA38S4L5_9ASTR|nr:hypothetical protein OSB04_un000301 [Centaurea solstitialis]
MAWKEEPPDYSCSLCKSCVDSHSHLFFMCSFANEVWKEVTLAIGWQNAPMAWDDMLLLMSDQATAPKRLIRKLAISATVYEVWIERNKRLFTEERRTSVQVTKLILSTIKLREEWKTARKITTNVCLILFVISNPKGEIVGCKIGLYPRSQVGAQSEDKGKVKVVKEVKACFIASVKVNKL